MLSHAAIYDTVYKTLYSAYGDDFILLKKDLTFEELAERIVRDIEKKQKEMAAA